MLGFQRVVIADDQRGLQWRDGRLQQVLLPGAYTRFDPFSRVRIETCELSRPEVGLAKAEHYLRAAPAVLADHVEEVRMGNFELGLVRIEGKLAGFLAPGGKALYWRDSQPVTIERLNLQGDPALPASLVRELLSVDTLLQRVVSTLFAIQEVAVGQVGLLRSDGRIESVLTPGLYGFVRVQRQLSVEVLDLRAQTTEVSGQEILTRDKLSLRVNLSASWRISDPVQARSSVTDFRDALYRELQFGLRQAIGTRTLDALLANKGELDQVVADYAAPRLQGYGIELLGVGIKDLILPGEMKSLLNQVVEAEKQAQANLVRRREETAATRSLLNTARLMEDNPTLLRLKELESLEKIVDKVGSLTVLGGIDSLLEQLRPTRP
ncbi:MAG: slipin family protein [Lysobacterales bacterium]